MILYHRTSAAEAILSEGFRDVEGTHMTKGWHCGVWLSDVPLDESDGAWGDTLLCVQLPDEIVGEYEWAETEGAGGRRRHKEFVVPAAIVNRYGQPARCRTCPVCDRQHGGEQCPWCEGGRPD